MGGVHVAAARTELQKSENIPVEKTQIQSHLQARYFGKVFFPLIQGTSMMEKSMFTGTFQGAQRQ